MKTTLEVRDDLFRRANALALARGITLKQLFTEALEERVGRASRSEKPEWKRLSGGLRAFRAERARYATWLEELIEVSTVLDIDRDTASRYAVVREALRRRGRPIPSNDAWIAALALQHELPVLSRDAHFDQVAGVRRVAW